MRMGHRGISMSFLMILTDRHTNMNQNFDIVPLGLSHPRHMGCTPRERLSAADRIAASLWRRRRPITTGILMKQCERDWAHLEHSPKAFDVGSDVDRSRDSRLESEAATALFGLV